MYLNIYQLCKILIIKLFIDIVTTLCNSYPLGPRAWELRYTNEYYGNNTNTNYNL